MLVAADISGILAISLDLVAGMLGLYSLAKAASSLFAAYFTTIVVNNLG